MIWHRLSVHSLLYACLALLLARGDAWALGSTPVTVVNPTDIAKAEGIQHPFQQSASCTFLSTFCNIPPGIPVPTGQRLVIEYVSGVCSIGGGGISQFAVLTTAGGVEVTHQLGILDHFGVGGVVPFGQTVRIYADAGSAINAAAFSTQFAGGSTCTFNFSGQAIDVP